MADGCYILVYWHGRRHSISHRCGQWGLLFTAVCGFSLRRLLLEDAGSRHTNVSGLGAQALSLHGMWTLPETGIKPVSPALAGRFLTTGSPEKSHIYSLHQFIWRLKVLHSIPPKNNLSWPKLPSAPAYLTPVFLGGWVECTMISHQDTRPLLWIIHPHRPTLSPIRQPRGLVLNNFVGNASHYTTCCQCRPSNATKHGRWEDFTKTHRCTLAVLLSNRRILDQNNHNKLLKTSSTLELALTKIVFPRMNFHLNAHGRKPRGLSWFTSIPCLSLSFSGFLSPLTWVLHTLQDQISALLHEALEWCSLPLIPTANEDQYCSLGFPRGSVVRNLPPV